MEEDCIRCQELQQTVVLDQEDEEVGQEEEEEENTNEKHAVPLSTLLRIL
jgi:hypothetical protein